MIRCCCCSKCGSITYLLYLHQKPETAETHNPIAIVHHLNYRWFNLFFYLIFFSLPFQFKRDNNAYYCVVKNCSRLLVYITYTFDSHHNRCKHVYYFFFLPYSLFFFVPFIYVLFFLYFTDSVRTTRTRRFNIILYYYNLDSYTYYNDMYNNIYLNMRSVRERTNDTIATQLMQ